jgi:hypothetical protein
VGVTPGRGREEVEEDEKSVRESIESSRSRRDVDDWEPSSGEEQGEQDFQTPAPKRRRVSVETIVNSQPYDVDYDDNETDTHTHTYNEHEDHDHEDNDAHAHDDFEDLLSSIPTLSSPPATLPIHRPAPHAPRFVFSTPAKAPSSTPMLNNPLGTFLKPPRFKPPDAERCVAAEPLPEQFSPHRRGQKFLPGGLAAEVRGWLVDLESRNARPQSAAGEWALRMLVRDVAGGGGAGCTLVKGCLVGGNSEVERADEVRMVLGGGEGMGEGLRKGEQARVGRVLSVKGPVWETDIDGVRWGVGAAWKVLE